MPAKKNGARRHVQVGIVAQAVVEHDHVQNVEQLPLVLMNSLDLAVEDRVGVDRLPGRRLEPVGEAGLGRALGAAEASRKAASSASGTSLLELSQVGDPAVADRLGDQAGEVGVGQQEPAPGRDAVGLVVEPLGEHLGQVVRRRSSAAAGVDLGDAVGAVDADDRPGWPSGRASRALPRSG